MKNTMLKKTMPLVAATWVDAFRRVCNRIALVAAALSGGIVTAKPRKLTGDLDGYWLYLKSGEARIGKRKGVMVIAY